MMRPDLILAYFLAISVQTSFGGSLLYGADEAPVATFVKGKSVQV